MPNERGLVALEQYSERPSDRGEDIPLAPLPTSSTNLQVRFINSSGERGVILWSSAPETDDNRAHVPKPQEPRTRSYPRAPPLRPNPAEQARASLGTGTIPLAHFYPSQ